MTDNEIIKAQADKIFLLESALKDKTTEIERLTELAKLGNKRALRAETETDKMITFAKSEAIKAFAERLKEKKLNIEIMRMPFLDRDIDNLVKEMTEVSE